MNASTPLLDLAGRAAAAVRAHPRRLTLAVLALLMGSAVTAFGVVAPAPSATVRPTQRLVSMTLPVSGLDQQLAQLDAHPRPLSRTELTRRADTLDSLLQRLGVSDSEAANDLRDDPGVQAVLDGRAGRLAQATVESGRLLELVLRGPAAREGDLGRLFTRVTVRHTDNGYIAHREQRPLHSEARLAAGTIRSSLYAATDDAMLPESVTGQLAEMFSNDIDFHRDIRRGDRFSVLYQHLTADGEPAYWALPASRILAARFVNAGNIHEALWFQAPGGKGHYFGFDGKSKTRQFLSAPLEFSRVTSGFSMRFHPFLNRWRAHLGVDYGAPTGTPVRSVGEGIVTFAGVQGGYGNMLIVRHDDIHETRYAHLSRIDARLGQRVAQGDLIGAVGATGWASGPHLHFEFRVKGEPMDPLVVARASEAARLPEAALPGFLALARDTQAQFEAAQTSVALSQRFE